jgi:putative transposase
LQLASSVARGAALGQAETIVRWHREGFRLFWRWRSKRQTAAKSRVGPEVIELIRRMALHNVTWGAERIRGELLKLGIRVAKRTVQRYMRGARPPEPHHGQSWATFLRNHTVWACDFLHVHDVWFRPLFAFFVVDVHRRRVVHIGVTRAPTAQWTARQIREATPFSEGPRVLLRDRDDKYTGLFDRVAKGAGVRVVRTAVEAPLMNATVERFLGSVRREYVDYVIILGERHLEHVLREYGLRSFNSARPVLAPFASRLVTPPFGTRRASHQEPEASRSGPLQQAREREPGRGRAARVLVITTSRPRSSGAKFGRFTQRAATMRC